MITTQNLLEQVLEALGRKLLKFNLQLNYNCTLEVLEQEPGKRYRYEFRTEFWNKKNF